MGINGGRALTLCHQRLCGSNVRPVTFARSRPVGGWTSRRLMRLNHKDAEGAEKCTGKQWRPCIGSVSSASLRFKCPSGYVRPKSASRWLDQPAIDAIEPQKLGRATGREWESMAAVH